MNDECAKCEYLIFTLILAQSCKRLTPQQLNKKMPLSIRITIAALAAFFVTPCIWAQGVRGYVMDEAGDTLPFVSVFKPNTGKGVSANVNGYYELSLDSGRTEEVVFQYVGYSNVRKTVSGSGAWQQLDIQMRSNVTELGMIEVRPGEEDPAYAIMRQAIARSKYHRLLVDAYTCKVYTRGSGKITEAPRFFVKLLERDDIYLNRTFTTESISELHFQQPDSVAEKVIAMRTVATETPSPNAYINASFYFPKVAGAISPLAPNAFFYYRFGYRGSFEENGRTIFKISVTPKTKGMDTYSGTIYICDGDFAIHSLDLSTYITGFNVRIKQLHQAVDKDIWMPVNHRIDFSGKIMGIVGAYSYIANVDEYDITINPSIGVIEVAIDEEETGASVHSTRDTVVTVNSKKDLKRELKRIEKEQRKQKEEPEVVTHRYRKVDSLATKWTEEQWLSKRPIPLSDDEQRGYDIGDSLAEVKGLNEDTTEYVKRFEWFDPLLGANYKLGKYKSLRWHSPLTLLGYNTVEGYFVQGRMTYKGWLRKKYQFNAGGQVRYGLSENTTFAKGWMEFERNNEGHKRKWSLNGGHFVEQFDGNQPISDFVNTLHTLLLGQNFQKLYARTYVGLAFENDWNKKTELRVMADANRRMLLENTSDERWLFTNRELLPNNPVENLVAHNAYRLGVDMTFRPKLTYRSYNGYKNPNIGPYVAEFGVMFRTGIYDDAADGFAHLQLNYAQAVSFGVSGALDWNVAAGTFFNTNPMFQDVKHFLANQTIFAPMNTRKQFRLMPYYTYFTQSEYVQAMTHYEFRKLLVTQFFYPRLMGVKEQVFVNGMYDIDGQHYLEAGYSLQNIFRAFRVDIGVTILPHTGRVGAMIGMGGFIQFE